MASQIGYVLTSLALTPVTSGVRLQLFAGPFGGLTGNQELIADIELSAAQAQTLAAAINVNAAIGAAAAAGATSSASIAAQDVPVLGVFNSQ